MTNLISHLADTGVLFLVVVVFIATWKTAQWKKYVDMTLGDLSKKVDGLSQKMEVLCQRMDDLTQKMDGLIQKMDGLTQRMDGLTQRMDGLTQRVDDLHGFFINKHVGPVVFKASSPLALNEHGCDIAQNIEAEDLAMRYADQVQKDINNMNAYQIQEHSFQYAKTSLLPDLEQQDPQRFQDLTGYAYEKGIKTDTIMEVVGILLRDVLLQRIGHSHQDPDKSDPAKPA